MRIKHISQSILFAVALSGFVSAAPCDELKALIDKTYNFLPSRLTDDQRGAKSDEMDVVWNTVGKDTAKFLPCLRSEIARRKTDLFFRFDASNLLFKHDQSVETKKLMIETYSGADLTDVSHPYWLMHMAKFGFEGLDVSKAGETWLRYLRKPPDQYLPRPVSKSLGALMIFGSMDESLATPALARLAAQPNTDFQEIAIALLIDQATPQSRNEVKKLKSKLPRAVAESMEKKIASSKLIVLREGTPKMSRDGYIKALTELLDGKAASWFRHTREVRDGERDMVVVLTTADIPLIRKVRRYYMSLDPGLAPEWHELFTQVIHTIEAKPKAKTPVARKGSI
jgi:hypothetical protein